MSIENPIETAGQAEHGLPDLIESVLKANGYRCGDPRPERNAGLGRLGILTSHRLIMLVLPQQRHRQAELCPLGSTMSPTRSVLGVVATLDQVRRPDRLDVDHE
jgi:hypothetical protein